MKRIFILLLTLLIITGCTHSSQIPLSNTQESSTTISSDASEIKKTEIPKETDVSQTTHDYYCDDFLLTANDKQIDLTTIEPELSSVSELYPISDDKLYILGRINENYNALMIYDFTCEEIIFSQQGSTMCWVQGKFETLRYLKDNMVYDFAGNIIYQPESSKRIDSIEYVVEDFKVTVTDENYTNYEEIWLP